MRLAKRRRETTDAVLISLQQKCLGEGGGVAFSKNVPKIIFINRFRASSFFSYNNGWHINISAFCSALNVSGSIPQRIRKCESLLIKMSCVLQVLSLAATVIVAKNGALMNIPELSINFDLTCALVMMLS